MKCPTKSLASLVVFLVGIAASGHSLADPFDTTIENNGDEISQLTCSKYLSMMQQRDTHLFATIIWLHGVASGLEGHTIPFNKQESIGVMGLAAGLCRDKPDKRLFDVFLDLKKQEIKAQH